MYLEIFSAVYIYLHSLVKFENLLFKLVFIKCESIIIEKLSIESFNKTFFPPINVRTQLEKNIILLYVRYSS
jgi:hypothetical protein